MSSHHETYAVRERRVQAAVLYKNRYPNISIQQVAKEFNIPRTTLSNRLHGRKNRHNRQHNLTALSNTEEKTLISIVINLEACGIFMRRRQLVHFAEQILSRRANYEQDEPEMAKLSAMWPSRFMKRHPEIEIYKLPPIERLRKMAHNPTTIEAWFRHHRLLLLDYGISREDLWNFDETGFAIGQGRSQYVVRSSYSNRGRDFVATTTNREHVTCIEAISAGGYKIPPFILFKGRHLLQKWYEYDLEPGTVIDVTDTGFSNDNIALQWIKHFEYHSRRTQRGEWRVLLCDNFESHVTKDFLEVCRSHKILVHCFPAHTTHLMQPLDVVAFQQVKQKYHEAVDNAAILGCHNFDKTEFLNVIQRVRDHALRPAIIYSSFRKSGMFPINEGLVLEPLRRQWLKTLDNRPYGPPEDTQNIEVSEHASERTDVLQPSTSSTDCEFRQQANFIGLETATPPSSPPPSPSSSLDITLSPKRQIPHTPQTPRALAAHNKTLQKRLLPYGLSSPTRDCFTSYIKGSTIVAESGRTAWKLLRDTQETNEQRIKRKKRTNRRINPTHGGLMTVEYGRQRALTRQEEEDRIYEARQAREAKQKERAHCEEIRQMDVSINRVDRELAREVRLEVQRAEEEERLMLLAQRQAQQNYDEDTRDIDRVDRQLQREERALQKELQMKLKQPKKKPKRTGQNTKKKGSRTTASSTTEQVAKKRALVISSSSSTLKRVTHGSDEVPQRTTRGRIIKPTEKISLAN